MRCYISVFSMSVLIMLVLSEIGYAQTLYTRRPDISSEEGYRKSLFDRDVRWDTGWEVKLLLPYSHNYYRMTNEEKQNAIKQYVIPFEQEVVPPIRQLDPSIEMHLSGLTMELIVRDPCALAYLTDYVTVVLPERHSGIVVVSGKKGVMFIQSYVQHRWINEAGLYVILRKPEADLSGYPLTDRLPANREMHKKISEAVIKRFKEKIVPELKKIDPEMGAFYYAAAPYWKAGVRIYGHPCVYSYLQYLADNQHMLIEGVYIE